MNLLVLFASYDLQFIINIYFRFEVMNINLQNKPDWFLSKNPEGIVPALEHDGKARCIVGYLYQKR